MGTNPEPVGKPLDEIAGRLQDYLGTEIGAVENLSMGWESDVYRYRLSTPAGEVARVVRLYFGPWAGQTARREEAALQQLRQAGYPVPEVFGAESDPAALGRPFLIMAHVPGRLLWPLMIRPDGEDAVASTRHLDRFCELFLALHRLPWPAGGSASPSEIASRTVAEQIDRLAGFGSLHPLHGFDEAMAWLRRQSAQVSPQPLVPVHWDFHPANILVDDAGHYAVIDWTQFEITDPRFDLAWTLLVVGSQAGWEHADRIRTRYEELAGDPVRDLAFFEAVACAKRLFGMLISLLYGAEQVGMRPEATAAMAAHPEGLARLYARWLQLTQIPLADAERRLAALL